MEFGRCMIRELACFSGMLTTKLTVGRLFRNSFVVKQTASFRFVSAKSCIESPLICKKTKGAYPHPVGHTSLSH